MRIRELERHLEQRIARGRLGHAYLLFGGAPAARQSFAERFAAKLEGAEGGVLLDARFVGGDEAAGIDEARALRGFLAMKPLRSSRRTAVILRGEGLTLQAQHAILKIAEEPPPSGLLVLLVQDPAALIGTLVSRFERFFISDAREDVSDRDTMERIRAFVNADRKGRSDLLKTMIDSPSEVERFVRGMIMRLKGELPESVEILGELLARWEAMNRYTLNKRLQLEAALLGLPRGL